MAIYHCSCKIISRGKGHSAVGASAYRSGTKMTNEYDGVIHDYTPREKTGQVVYSEVMLCENAPKEYQNREVLWNEVEKIEKSSKAQLAREYEVALPRELSHEEQIKLTRYFVQENFVKKGMCADVSIHDKGDGNPHAHILVTMRPIEKDGTWGSKSEKLYLCKNAKGEKKYFTAKELAKRENKEWQKQYDKKKQTYKCKTVKANDWDSAEFLKRNRKAWAVAVNQELERKNLPARIDHRSYEERGIDKIPTIHEGKSARVREEKRNNPKYKGRYKEKTERIETNREINDINRSLGSIREDMTWIRLQEHFYKIENALHKNPANAEAQKQVLESIPKLEAEITKIAGIQKRNGYHADKFYDMGEKGKIAYVNFHANKALQDVGYLKELASRNLAEIEKINATQQHQPKPAHADPKQVPGAQAVSFDVESVAMKLENHRAEFVKATIQAGGRTSYQENPIYRQQAMQISEYAKVYREQSATIQNLKEQRAELGLFQSKQKKALDNKITDFERLRRGNEDKLKALGVSDISKADDKIKELNSLAEQEKVKVQEARENIGASGRAEKAKADFHELVKTVPDNMKPVIAEKMEQIRGKDNRGSMESYLAEIQAQRELDTALKKPAGEPERNRQKTQEHRR